MSMQASLSANARARFKRHLCHVLLYVVLLTMAAVCFFPFLAMLIGSTQDNLTITTMMKVNSAPRPLKRNLENAYPVSAEKYRHSAVLTTASQIELAKPRQMFLFCIIRL